MNTVSLNRALKGLDKHTWLECDGMTRVISSILTSAGIEHLFCKGSIQDTKSGFSIVHFWIEMPNGQFIDYRARMWLGNTAPHGVFNPKDVKHVKYIVDSKKPNDEEQKRIGYILAMSGDIDYNSIVSALSVIQQKSS